MRSEALGYWYFRLNGCLTIVNFVLHPRRAGSQRTDADVLAVRFPSRVEHVEGGRPLVDDAPFQGSAWLDVVVAEVKAGPCQLNGPWSARARGNLEYALNAIGVLPAEQTTEACAALYDGAEYQADGCRVRLFALGRQRTPGLPEGVVQVEWAEVLAFVWDRFRANSRAKADHQQWDATGQRLWNEVMAKPRAAFVGELLESLE